MDDLLARSAEELFTRHCPPQAVRAARAGQVFPALWQAVEEAGFTETLVPEAAGGAGLGPDGALPLLLAAGRFAAPLPLGETMLARAALATAGERPPEGPVALAQPSGAGGPLLARIAPGRQAAWVLLPREEATLLLPVAEAETLPEESSPLGTTLRWHSAGGGLRLPPADWLAAGAWAEAAEMAGALGRILEDTVRHARERQQFGRPVAAFQAVQQQISVLTEEVFAARTAAQLASLGGGDGVAGLDTARVAAAKLRVGEAAVRGAAIAHAVQGAMGITEEVDLHLFTGRLHAGRARFGSEGFWAAWLGRAFLAGPSNESLAFARERLGPSAGAGV